VGSTPQEAFTGRSPDLSQLRTFGCITYYRIADDLRKKLDSKANVGYYLGPSLESKAVRILIKDPVTGRMSVTQARDVVTVERYLTHPNVPAAQFFERVQGSNPQGAAEGSNPQGALSWDIRSPLPAPPKVAGPRPANDLNYGELLQTAPIEGFGTEDLADHQVAGRQDPGREAIVDPGNSSIQQEADTVAIPGASNQKRSRKPKLKRRNPRSVVDTQGSDCNGRSSVPSDDLRRYPARKRAQPERLNPSAGKRVRFANSVDHLGPVSGEGGGHFRSSASARTVVHNGDSGRGSHCAMPSFAQQTATACYVQTALNAFDTAMGRAVLGQVDGYEPVDFYDATRQPDWEQWKEALNSEMSSLLENETWTLVKREPGMKVIPSKWVFKLKRDSQGRINRYKCRLVAGGHRQKHGIDFDETFAPVSKATSLRVLLSVAAFNKWKVHQFDIKTAFLHGDIDIDVYMEQPQGFEMGLCLVCKLTKCLYGLKQAPRAWFAKLTQFLETLGLGPSVADPSIWFGKPFGLPVYISLVVDDTLVTSPDESHTRRLIHTILQRFKGEPTSPADWYVGMKLNWQPDGTVILTQRAHIEKILKEHFPEGVTPRTTPVPLTAKFTRKGKALDTRKHNYASVVGAFLFLGSYTRIDIVAIINRYAKYISCPTQELWELIVHTMGYLLHTIDCGLHLGRNHTTVMYADSDYASCIDTRRSHTGWVFILYGSAVCWQSKCQTTVAVSTTEAEYQAVASSAREALWLRQLLPTFGINLKQFMIRTDSMGAMNSLKNPQITQRTKHIDVMHHFVRERCAKGDLTLEFVIGAKNLADFLTKPVPKEKHLWTCHKVGIARIDENGIRVSGLYPNKDGK
jgi:hypothetical protein